MIARVARRLQARHLLVIDLVGIFAAACLALGLRYDVLPGPALIGPVLPTIFLLMAVRTACNSRLGLYSRGWRFASIPDVFQIAAAMLVGTIACMILFYSLVAIAPADMPAGFPRSFWPIEMLLAIAILGGVRFTIRAAFDWSPEAPARAAAGQHLTLLYGAGRTGVLMARSAERNPGHGRRPGRLPR